MPSRKESKGKVRLFEEGSAVTTRVRGVEAMVDVVHGTARLANGEIINLSHREMQIAGLANRFGGDSPKRLSGHIKQATGERVSPNMVAVTLQSLLRKLGGKNRRDA